MQEIKEKVLIHLIKNYLKEDLYKTDFGGETALHIACYGDYTDEKLSVVKILLENNFNPHTLNYNGEKANPSSRSNDRRCVLLQNACHSKQSLSWNHQPPASNYSPVFGGARNQDPVKETPVKSQPKVKRVDKNILSQ